MSSNENNRLIAEFMGAYRPEKIITAYEGTFLYMDGKRWCQFESLKYHTSWDWLMPVVEKIENLHDGVFALFIVENACSLALDNKYRDDGEDWNAPKIQIEADSKIKATYQAVVQFIQWYNQTTK